MGILWQDLRTAARSLSRTPGITLAAVLALGLGIGATAAMFGFVDALVLRPFSFSTDGLALLTESSERNPRQEATTGSFHDWKEARAFSQLEAFQFWELNLTGVQEPEHLIGDRVTAGFFDVLGAQPALGRGFARGEDTPGHDRVVVLSHALWQRRFGGERSVLGTAVRIDGESYQVIGVMPPDFLFPKAAELWAPLVFGPEARHQRTAHWLGGVARLAPGVSIAAADAELAGLARRQEKLDPGHGAHVVPLRDFGDPELKILLIVCLCAVGLVLLIACANVGSLLLARASGRGRELAIRAALGASRSRLVRLLLTESLLLAALAFAAGLLFARWGIDLMVAPMPADVARWIVGWTRIGLDARLMAFCALASLLTAGLAGLRPALRASRLQLHEALQREGLSASVGRERLRGQRLLLGAETALALVLVSLSALLVQSLVHVREARLGFAPAHVLTLRVAPGKARYGDAGAVARYFDEALRRLSALPGVAAVGAINRLPQSGSWEEMPYLVQGHAEQVLPKALYQPVMGGYFAAMGIPLLRGRLFEAADRQPGARTVLISEELARREFGEREPLGAQLRLGPSEQEPWLSIVGVVAEVRHRPEADGYKTAIYQPEEVAGRRQLNLVVRAAGEPMALAAAVRAELRALDAEQPISELKPMVEVIRQKAMPWDYAAGLLGTLAGLALLLGAVGIYGVMAYSVSQRLRELGIRLALGASPRDVVRLVVREGMLPALIGLACGLIAAVLIAPALGGILVDVRPGDALTHAGAALFLGAVALCASWLPARRAASVDPAISLRAE